MDVSEREPLDVVSCPGCGQSLTVVGEIAGYQLIKVAGRGGMGVVYKAYDPALDRDIAIKRLRKEHSTDRNLTAQLENEATMTAAINDPHVVNVYGTGFDRGRFYLAMELAENGSLDNLMQQQGRVDEVRVLQIGIQIAQGLRAAYQHGLIHRDVKPGNILFGDNHLAKIVDFGLAIFMDQASESSGEIWGTPYYVAPEKLDGGIEDFRSDIYSLGATLFHALAGRAPFEAASPTLVALKHLKSQAVSLQAFAPWVSNPTAHIINQTLAKNPAERFASYDDFIASLQYALAQLESGQSAAPSKTRVVLESETLQKKFTWLVLAMVVAIVALAVGLFLNRPPKTVGAVGTTVVVVTPKPSSFQDHLGKLIPGEPAAVAVFRDRVNQGSESATDEAWTLIFAGVAEWLAGNSVEARDDFGRVPVAAERMKDKALAAFLVRTSGILASNQPLPVDQVRQLDQTNYQAVGYLLHGLHSWVNNRTGDSVELLRDFRSVNPEGQAKWIKGLESLASTLVSDALQIEAAPEVLEKEPDALKRASLAADLRQMGPLFAARVEAVLAPYSTELGALEGRPKPAVYRIVNKHNKCMDIIAHGTNAGTRLVQWEDYGGANQMWELVERKEGTVALRSMSTGMWMALANSTAKADAQVQVWPENGTAAIEWKVEPKDAPWVTIRSAATNQILCVTNATSGTAITQTDKVGVHHEEWRFVYVGKHVGDWVTADIGHSSPRSETTWSNGVLRLKTFSGDVWNTADSFRFTFQEVPGDFDYVARVAEMSKPHDFAKVGLMVRSGAVPNAAGVFVNATPSKGIAHQVRPKARDPMRETPRLSAINSPCWLKLTRRGPVVASYYSKDGNSWTEVGSEAVPAIITAATVGIAVSSHENAEFTATVDNIKLTRVPSAK